MKDTDREIAPLIRAYILIDQINSQKNVNNSNLELTLLQVTNPSNGRMIVVRVNDRGPFVRGRIVDLSWAAAKVLGILSTGVANVIIEPLEHFHIPMKRDRDNILPRVYEAVETEEFPWKPIHGHSLP